MSDQRGQANRPGAMPEQYQFDQIESYWQRIWDERDTFVASDDDPRPKLYVLQMFPYPSGDLHAGHIRNYVIGDAVARYWRMRGYNVMHPMGFDSFGLPAEQAAIDRGVQPSAWIERCVTNSRRQFKRYGFTFDWSREVVTSDPAYYKWTQWLFLKFYEMGLIYRKQIEVNWCPEHGVLANDEVKDGACWRCDAAVVRKKMEQWCMHTTQYARRLLDGLERIPGWTDAVRTMQRNWIGESTGTHITFDVPAIAGKLPEGLAPELTVFTTRVDTIFGCTFMAIAPDHPLAEHLAAVGGTSAQLEKFGAECAREAVEYGVAEAEDKPKRGLHLGVECINPFNGEAIPIFATNYVVSDFGTGAVMAVPAHDTRDHAFAKEYDLVIRQVIAPAQESNAGNEGGQESNAGKEGGRPSGKEGGRSSVAALTSSDGVQISRHRLPHWELSGAIYFISWRLASEQPKFKPAARSIVMSALKHFHEERYDLIAAVVMDDHVHVLVKLHEGQELGKTLHSWRSFTANRLQREYDYLGAVWQDEYFHRIIRTDEEFNADLQYIINNLASRWPELKAYEWLVVFESNLEVLHSEIETAEQEIPAVASEASIDRAVSLEWFQRWFWAKADEYKALIRDFEHGKEHYHDRRVAYHTWFRGGMRPKLLREAPQQNQLDELAPENWITLLVGYLMLGRGVTKDYLAGRTEAFGFQVAIPDDLLQEMIRAARDDRPPVEIECFVDKGVCINSAQYDGMDFDSAKAAMDKWLAEQGKGGAAVQYRLRDWNMGRQRYWGAPIPMVMCDTCGWQPVPKDQLPVRLPEEADYSDIRVSPLANDEKWQRATCPCCGDIATRDTDTMTTFMCSAWYFLRFCDPENDEAPFDAAKAGLWLPVDYYVGGKEHAVGHLLYSRFVTQVLADAGMLKLSKRDHLNVLPGLDDEPFLRLFNQGIVYKGGAKMSKSKGNVVSADDLADQYGADTARLFAFFGGPADQDLEWTTSGVEGCHRFLKRIWRLAHAVNQGKSSVEICGDACRAAVRARHRAVAGVSEDIVNWRFNTAIAKMMEYLNDLEALWQRTENIDESQSFRNAILTLAQLIGPFAPHISEELWKQMGGMGLCCESDWPIYDPEILVEATVELPVQINGKVRGRITVPTEAGEADVFSAAEADERVAQWLEGKRLIKRIYVPGRMVTLVVK